MTATDLVDSPGKAADVLAERMSDILAFRDLVSSGVSVPGAPEGLAEDAMALDLEHVSVSFLPTESGGVVVELR